MLWHMCLMVGTKFSVEHFDKILELDIPCQKPLDTTGLIAGDYYCLMRIVHLKRTSGFFDGLKILPTFVIMFRLS